MESAHTCSGSRRSVIRNYYIENWADKTEQACDPTLPEPNYPVMVELADMIKSKKANRQANLIRRAEGARKLTISARDATHALLGNINSRNPNQSLLGLAVLDHLVKNGGYPIHLQIATKEFLNELVRRFPERPPMVTGRVMGRILEVSAGLGRGIGVGADIDVDDTRMEEYALCPFEIQGGFGSYSRYAPVTQL